MKQILFIMAVLVFFSSCVNQRQKSNYTGKTDEVYFTPSDIKVKTKGENKAQEVSTPSSKNYTESYADRLNNFGSGNYYTSPVIIAPSAMYNNYSGWNFGMSFGFGYSPYGPYYYDPYYMYGWSGAYYMNPWYCSGYYPYHYPPTYYGGSNYYYPSYNYGRRTGISSPSGNKNTTPTRTATSTNDPNNQGSSSSGKSKWWQTIPGSTTTSPSSRGGSSGGGDRGSSGSSGNSTRRR